MIYGKVAKRLAEKGFAVVPLMGKAPRTPNWQQTTSKNILTDSKYDNWNIGLLTGEPSGVIVADIDTFEEELESQLYAIMPKTPLMKKGKKGINFFYRFTGEETIKIHNPYNSREVEFELISTGRQTVIPRSIHPDSKKPYIWCDKNGYQSNNHLLNVSVEELPVISKEKIDEIKRTINNYFKNKQSKVQSLGIAGDLQISDAGSSHKDREDYNPSSLDSLPPEYRDRCRTGSHDAIVKLIMALQNKGYNKAEIISRVIAYDKEYNKGYAETYLDGKTTGAKGNTTEERAEYYYNSSFKTVEAKREEAGMEMPVVSPVISDTSHKEMDIVFNLLKDNGIHYDQTLTNFTKEENRILMKEGRDDSFGWNGKYWAHLMQDFNDKVYRRINQMSGFKKAHSGIVAIQNKFMTYVPSIDRDKSFFRTNPYMCNVKNGTLHYQGGKLVFKPHNKDDFCTSMIDIDYNPDAVNEKWEEMLMNIFENDMDKYYALSELCGIAIMGIVSRVGFLYGKSGSGKSTIGKVISQVLGMDNFCSVGPNSFDSFNMESMINKLVNMDLDISVAKPISDGVFKKIEDRMPIRISRKFKEDIYALIPALHLFGANQLPKNFDSVSGAYKRRITIIPCNRSFTSNGQKYNRNIAKEVFDHCPEGILNFFVKGLQRLIDNDFVFTVPKDGEAAMDEWDLESDPVGLFLEDIKNNEVMGIEKDPILDPEQEIKRADLWAIFNKWKDEVGRRNSKITRNKFYKICYDKGYVPKKRSDSFYIKGIGYVKDTVTVAKNNNSANMDNY